MTINIKIQSIPHWVQKLPSHSQIYLFGGAIRDGSLNLSARDYD